MWESRRRTFPGFLILILLPTSIAEFYMASNNEQRKLLARDRTNRIGDFHTKEYGTGPGLAITYSIVKKHRGQIIISSEVGKGTRCLWISGSADKTVFPSLYPLSLYPLDEYTSPAKARSESRNYNIISFFQQFFLNHCFVKA